ncbi:hypothetical protein ACFLWG_00010 [Chloroflexota bacterium]
MKRLLGAVLICVALLLTVMIASPTVVLATDPSGGCTGGDCDGNSPGPPLTMIESITLPGGYVAAGTGMRNLGYGTINISGIPSGSTVKKAYLYWTILDHIEESSFSQGMVNGQPILGTQIGTDTDPCWLNNLPPG